MSVSLDRRAGRRVGPARLGRRAPGRAGYGEPAVIDVAAVTAIDVHVHTELTRAGHDPMPPQLRAAAARYFKSDQPLPTVDDVAGVLPRAQHGRRRLHRRLGVAQRHPADPERGDRRGGRREPGRADPVRERRPGATRRGRARPAADRRARRQGLQVPPQPAGLLPERPRRVPALRGDRGGRPACALPLRAQRHRHGGAGRRRPAPEVLEPDVPRRRGRRLPRARDRARAPVVSVAGRGDLGLPAQGQRLDRPLGLVAEVLPAAARPVREHAAAGEGALRLRLPAASLPTAGSPTSSRRRSRTRCAR